MTPVSSGGPPLHVRYFEVTRYGRTTRHRIDPGAYRCSELAAELADRYGPVHREMPQSAERVVVGVRAFLRWICTQSDPLPCSLAEVTAAHIQQWERWLGQRQQAQQSHSAYDKFVNFRALLLRIAHDEPLATHPTLRLLLASPTVTVLPEMRPAEGLPPFSHGEHRQIIAASYRDVAAALDLARSKSHKELAQRMGPVLTALHILLSAGSGEPPEVLRNLRLSDIRPLVPGAEVDAPGGEARASWLQEVVRGRPVATASSCASFALTPCTTPLSLAGIVTAVSQLRHRFASPGRSGERALRMRCGSMSVGGTPSSPTEAGCRTGSPLMPST